MALALGLGLGLGLKPVKHARGGSVEGARCGVARALEWQAAAACAWASMVVHGLRLLLTRACLLPATRAFVCAARHAPRAVVNIPVGALCVGLVFLGGGLHLVSMLSPLWRASRWRCPSRLSVSEAPPMLLAASFWPLTAAAAAAALLLSLPPLAPGAPHTEPKSPPPGSTASRLKADDAAQLRALQDIKSVIDTNGVLRREWRAATGNYAGASGPRASDSALLLSSGSKRGKGRAARACPNTRCHCRPPLRLQRHPT